MDTPSPTVQPGYRRQTPPHRFGSSHAGFAGREAILGPALRGLVLFSCFPLSPPHPPPDTKRGHCFSGRTHRSAGQGPNRTLVHPKDGERTMKRCCGALILMVLGSQVLAQEVLPESPAPTSPLIISEDMTAPAQVYGPGDTSAHSHGGFLSVNHNFPDFIGWMSNPLQNIDPRAVTAIYPIFGSAWVDTNLPLPAADFQLYGPALTVALSDRFAVGLNQGGYADVHLSTRDANLLAVVAPLGRQRLHDLLRQDPRTLLAFLRKHGLGLRDLLELRRLAIADPLGRFTDVEVGGDRSGWLNLGGFAQYTLIEDPAGQFLLTAGLRWEAPCGSHEIFQGH